MKDYISALLLFSIVTLSSLSASAQYVPQQKVVYEQSPSAFYLSFSTGIDNYTGLIGLGGLFPFDDKFSLRAGAGLGAWGAKLSVGVEYMDLVRSGIGFGLSYSLCPGFDEVDLTFQDQTGANKVVNVNLHTVGSVNMTIKKNWVFKKGHIFYLESGYAFQTGGNDFYSVNDNNVTLTQEEELILQILRPGGIILAMGFLVAF